MIVTVPVCRVAWSLILLLSYTEYVLCAVVWLFICSCVVSNLVRCFVDFSSHKATALHWLTSCFIIINTHSSKQPEEKLIWHLEPVAVGGENAGSLQCTLSSQQEGSYHVLQVIALKCRTQQSGQQLWYKHRDRTPRWGDRYSFVFPSVFLLILLNYLLA